MKKPIHILIIEDNEDDTILEVDALREGGLEIIFERVDTPEAMKETLHNRSWDCILSDYSMPHFSGLDALAILKETSVDIPFILISGAIGEETAVNAMKAGVHDYIMKSNLNRLVPALERELREAEVRRQKKLAENSMKFERILLRTLIDNLPDLIYIKDTQCCKIVSNRADVQFVGYSSESEVIGKTDLEIYRNEYGKRSHAADLEVLQNGSSLINAEVEIKDAAGNDHCFLTSKIPIHNAQGQISGLVGIAHDITDRKKMEVSIIDNEKALTKQNLEYEALNKEYSQLNEEITESLERIKRMNDELTTSKNKAEESDRLKSAFLANMSHEIRTPLNAILGFSNFLKNPELSKERTNEYVDIIETSGHQLLAIINDILEISQIESGHMRINPEPVNISKLLNELFLQFHKEASAKNIELILNINRSAEDIITKTDVIRIRQILSNLLNNAIKFTHKGKVEFSARLHNNQVVFYIKDTGIGIAPEDQAVIFQPFRQVETTMSRNYGGNGLGLSISRALVERLGGKLSLNSIPGKGSTFTFTIPYVNEDHKQDNMIHQPEQQNDLKAYNWGNHLILVAEDEMFNYRFLEEILSPTSVKILHAKTGQDAVQLVKDYPDISLVIMDLKMPGMDGYMATRLIKEIRPKLPVIAQTAAVLNESGDDDEKEGFDRYLSKPLEIRSFMETIDNYLD
jgi:PAS domain S-box-containing protein